MAKYGISGVWKDDSGVITHYGFHTVTNKSISKLIKKTKREAVMLAENTSNSIITILWNYKSPGWYEGEQVIVVDGKNGRFLRSTPDDTERDNLEHLIDYGMILNLI